MLTDSFFDDFDFNTNDSDLLIHTIDIYRSDPTILDEAGGNSFGTTANVPKKVYSEVPCLVADMRAFDVEKWQRRQVAATHDVFFGTKPPPLRTDDLLVLHGTGRFFRLAAFTDILIQGIVQQAVAKEIPKVQTQG